MRSRLHLLAVMALTTGMGSGLTAFAVESGVCSADLHVDKEKLAAFLLSAHPVSTTYLSVGDHPAPLSSHRALVGWLLGKRAEERLTNGGACTDDSCRVDALAAHLQAMLDGSDRQFTPTAGATATQFFAPGNRDQLVCERADARPSSLPSQAAPIGGEPAPVSARSRWQQHLRIRGNPDQLSVDRANQAAYASVDRAQLTLANDDLAQSRTNDIAVFAGYAFDKRAFRHDGSTYEAVPYVGFKQNRVSTYGNDGQTVSTSRTSQIGMLSAFHFAQPGTENSDELTARPDYLINSGDGSRLLTMNFTLTPVRSGTLNDFIGWSNGIAVKPILSGQSRNGLYVNRGDASVHDIHQDFIRLGAQAGFTLLSTNPGLPFDLTTSFTSLKALRGAQSIHYWKTTLNYNLNKSVGLSLNYADGVLPDTGDAERKWNLGVAAKF